MIAQSAPSIAGCIQEGTHCGSAGTQQREAKGCENSSCASVLDAGVKDQIARGRAIFLCRVMTSCKEKGITLAEALILPFPHNKAVPHASKYRLLHASLPQSAPSSPSLSWNSAKNSPPLPQIEAKHGVRLLAAKTPLKTTFNSSAFTLLDKKECHHSKDF